MSNQNEQPPIIFHNTVNPTVNKEDPFPTIELSTSTNPSTRSKRYYQVLTVVLSAIVIAAGVGIILAIKLKKKSNTQDIEPIATTTIKTILTTISSGIIINNNVSTTSIGNTTIMSLSTTTVLSACNITACRGVISYYLSRGWAYDTINFGECLGCTRATYPNYPSDWSNRWYILDVYIPTSAGQDCSGNPMTGNITVCQRYCLRDITCMGFSRQKNVSDFDGTGQCWLKNNIQSNQAVRDLTWQTVAFNSGT